MVSDDQHSECPLVRDCDRFQYLFIQLLWPERHSTCERYSQELNRHLQNPRDLVDQPCAGLGAACLPHINLASTGLLSIGVSGLLLAQVFVPLTVAPVSYGTVRWSSLSAMLQFIAVL